MNLKHSIRQKKAKAKEEKLHDFTYINFTKKAKLVHTVRRKITVAFEENRDICYWKGDTKGLLGGLSGGNMYVHFVVICLAFANLSVPMLYKKLKKEKYTVMNGRV